MRKLADRVFWKVLDLCGFAPAERTRDMPLIDPGKKAPAFNLNDQQGKTHRLADYGGKPVVLFFYPKDNTPGCTKEACD